MPSYQVVARDLRQQIDDGRLPLGQALPSTQQLVDQYKVSTTVTRAAISQLKAAGLVVGRPGKGVYVQATSETVARDADAASELLTSLLDLTARVDQQAGLIVDLSRRVTTLEQGARPG